MKDTKTGCESIRSSFFVKNSPKTKTVLVQVHNPRGIPGLYLDEYLNEYYNVDTTCTRTSTYEKEQESVARSVVYLRSGFRRPVRLRRVSGFADVQGRLPFGWCESCGAEIFDGIQALCGRCKRRMEDENEGESLRPLPESGGT